MVKESWRFEPGNAWEILTFGLIASLFSIGFFYIAVPVHEFGHSFLGAVQGKETLALHWGDDTDEWVALNYPGAYSITYDSGFLGICVLSEEANEGNWQLAHQIYEVWWIGFVVLCSLSYAYVAMAVFTKRFKGVSYGKNTKGFCKRSN